MWGEKAVVIDTEVLDWTEIDSFKEGTLFAQEAPDWTKDNNNKEGTSLA